MKRLLLFLGLLVPGLCLAENLFNNSAMDTTGAWRGDRRFEKVEGNAVISLEAKKNKTVSFAQDVNTARTTDLVLKLRYQTTDYTGRGVQLRATRMDDSSTFHNRQLVADGKWHDLSWNFSEVRGSNRITFSVELLEGTGKVLFDDVTVEPK
jgi:hypothetical protein